MSGKVQYEMFKKQIVCLLFPKLDREQRKQENREKLFALMQKEKKAHEIQTAPNVLYL